MTSHPKPKQVTFLRIEYGRAIMSDGFKYTMGNLQMKMKNIGIKHQDYSEFQRAYETLIHHS